MGVIDQLRSEIRVRHYSIRTEQTYTEWVVRFVRYHNLRHPKEMGVAEVNAFLTHLAVDQNVAASTQNQALNALIFFYKHVIRRDLGDLGEVVRAKRPVREPVVLSVDEVERVLSHLRGVHRLMVLLMYGAGLRLIEVIRLRVKDVDFDYGALTVRDGKGQKDRQVPLPQVAVAGLREQLRKVKDVHDRDLREGYGSVHLPFALARKYPNTERAFHWQYVFPSPVLSIDPRSGRKQRHHVYESVLQKSIRDASARAGVRKDVHSHTMRHSFATHLLAAGSDIRTVQELLGHEDVKTTMIYTHVLKAGPQGVRSPADRLRAAAVAPELTQPSGSAPAEDPVPLKLWTATEARARFPGAEPEDKPPAAASSGRLEWARRVGALLLAVVWPLGLASVRRWLSARGTA